MVEDLRLPEAEADSPKPEVLAMNPQLYETLALSAFAIALALSSILVIINLDIFWR